MLSKLRDSLCDNSSLLALDHLTNEPLEALPLQTESVFTVDRSLEDLVSFPLPPLQLTVSQCVERDHFQSLVIMVHWL